MKKSIAIMACCLAVASVSDAAAATGFKSVLIEHTDGQTTHILIEPEMKTEFADGQMVLSYEGGGVIYEMRHELEQMRHWTFTTSSADSGDLWALIDNVDGDGATVLNWRDNGVLVSNIGQASAVGLYGVDGRLYRSETATGECMVSFDGLAKGTYLLTVGGKTFKIAVK